MSSAAEVIEAEATVIEEELSPLAGAERWLAAKRAEVAAEASQFEAFEVTDTDTYKMAKRDRGLLNKKVRAINAERVDKMKAITAAVAQLKQDTDGVTKPLSDVAGALDAECKRWELGVIAARRDMLRQTFEDAAPDIALPQEGADAPLVSFDRMLERFGTGQLGKKWLLFGTSDRVAVEALMEAIGKVADGERTIDAMVAEEDRETVKGLYFETLDMDAAMARARELADMRTRMEALAEERRIREAEQRAAEEAARKADDEARAAEVRAAREKAEAEYVAGVRTGVTDMPGVHGSGNVTRAQMNAIDMVKSGAATPQPHKVPAGERPAPRPATGKDVPESRMRVTLAFEQPLSELVLDVTADELELFRRILRQNNVRGVIRGMRRQ
jgi:hypothetical protein